MTTRPFFRTAAALTLVATMTLLAGCGGKPKPDEEKDEQPEQLNALVGVLLPRSGLNKTEGDAILAGLELALKLKGNAVGLDKSSLKIEDYGTHPEDLASYLSNLIEAEEVSVIVGPIEPDRVKVCESLAAKSKVPVLTSSSAEIPLMRVGSTVWRLTYTDAQEGRAMAEFAAKKRYATVAVIDDSDMPASIARGDAFFERFEALAGAGTVTRISYDRDVLDFRRIVRMVAYNTHAKPAAFYLTGRRLEVANVLQQLKSMNVTGAVLGSTDWDAPRDFTLEVTPAASIFAPCRFFPERDDMTTRGFVKAFRSATGRDPGVLEALGYDAGLVVIDALKKGGDKPGAAAREIAGLKLLSGVTGQLAATGGSLASEITVLRLVGKKFEYESNVKLK